MKLVRADDKEMVFHLTLREKEALDLVLDMYPLLNPDYHTRHPASRSDVEDPKLVASRALLEEAMADQKAQQRRQLEAHRQHPPTFVRAAKGIRWTVPAADVEWLLQVVNDVRVGSWDRLGRPDPDEGRKAEVTSDNVRYLAGMQIGGFLEMALIEAAERK